MRRSILVAVVLASSWPVSGCGSAGEPQPPAPEGIASWSGGSDTGRGNLLGIQAWLHPQDYATAARFEQSLRVWFDAAQALDLLRSDTVVVLPEYVGTWLVAVDEAEGVYRAATSEEALAQVVAADPEAWLTWKQDAPADDDMTYAVFAMKAERMAEVYQAVFAKLAVDFDTTIVAGSTILPEPEIVSGRIVVHPGQPLRNVAFVFGPDGSLLGPPVVKAFPTATEQPFVQAGDSAQWPVFETTLGTLGVLVCADAWFPESYAALANRGLDALAVPVFVSGDGYWDAPWQGYSGYPPPADVDLAHVGVLTEGEAWRRYALPGRIAEAGVRAGMTVPLRGAFWDMVSDGHGFAVLDGECLDVPEVDAPLLANLWL